MHSSFFFFFNFCYLTQITCQQLSLSLKWSNVLYICICLSFVFQQYKYKDLTVREITNVISQYKDLKPVMDAYGNIVCTVVYCFRSLVSIMLGCSFDAIHYLVFQCLMMALQEIWWAWQGLFPWATEVHNFSLVK